jgi:glutaminase
MNYLDPVCFWIGLDGATLWTRVGREPSGTPFNSLVQLEYEQGIPRNPFINADALVVTGLLAIIPGRCSVCVWSPGLDEKGNSIAGIMALDTFTTLDRLVGVLATASLGCSTAGTGADVRRSSRWVIG